MPSRPFLASIMWGTRFLVFASITGGMVHGDELDLRNGARLSGRVLAEPSNRAQVVGLESEYGGRIWLPEASVSDQRLDESWKVEYERIAPTFDDTVEGQMAAAAWCTERKRPELAGVHLRRVVEIAPNFAPAWRALGYSHIRGEWMRRSDFMESRGYTFVRGRWRLSQEIDRSKTKEWIAAEQRDWLERIQRILASSRAEKGGGSLEQLSFIRDPLALPALLTVMSRESNPLVRIVLVKTISKIQHPDALAALVRCSLTDGSEDVFLACVDEVIGKRRTDVVPAYVASLKAKSVVEVNRAAHVLGKLGEESAVLPLADALFTPVIIPLKPFKRGNNMTAMFLKDPPTTPPSAGSDKLAIADAEISPLFTPLTAPALKAGDSPEFRVDWVPNEYVLRALTQISGGYNFGYAPALWRNWYADTVRLRESGRHLKAGRAN